jgi:hypothetical protein
MSMSGWAACLSLQYRALDRLLPCSVRNLLPTTERILSIVVGYSVWRHLSFAEVSMRGAPRWMVSSRSSSSKRGAMGAGSCRRGGEARGLGGQDKEMWELTTADKRPNECSTCSMQKGWEESGMKWSFRESVGCSTDSILGDSGLRG